MSITTCQKVTLISCSVLCVSLFLPRMFLSRGKKEIGQPEVGPGFYPPMMHQLPEETDPWGVDAVLSKTQSAGVIAKAKGMGRGKKYNLMAQVIPIYGFGILLYILYIIYKLTCKGKTTKSGYISTLKKAHVASEITADAELVRLQERLLQTERMVERMARGKGRASGSGRKRKSKPASSKKEDKLLRQLRQITELMQEGRLEGASPEMEAEEVPYGADWEGYPEETFPQYDEPCGRHGSDIVLLESPTNQPTAEALAERMEQEEEELAERKLDVVQEEDEDEEEEEEEEEEEVHEEEEDMEEEEEGEEEEEEDMEEAERRQLLSPLPSMPTKERRQERIGLEVSKEVEGQSRGKKQITFSEHKDVYRYPKEDNYEGEEEEEEVDEEEEEVDEEDEEEDEDGVEEEEGMGVEEEEDMDEEDPVMEAESLNFSSEVCSKPEEEAEGGEEETLLMLQLVEDEGRIHADTAKEAGVRSGLRRRRET